MKRYAQFWIGLFMGMTSILAAQPPTTPPKTRIFIKEFKIMSSNSIFLTGSQLTQIIFDELTKITEFEVKYLAQGESPKPEDAPDLIVEGECQLEGNLLSLDYVIRNVGTASRVKQSISRTELDPIKIAILKNFTEIFQTVTFISAPPGAEIDIDGIRVGRTPLTLKYLLSGNHLITINKSGYFSSNLEFLEDSRQDTVRATLTPITQVTNSTPPAPIGGMSAILNFIRYHKLFASNPEMRNLKIQGEIILAIKVDKTGKVTESKIIKSIGHEIVDKIAIEAVESVDWIPWKSNDQPTDGETRVQLKLNLGR
ncbi:TonB family protein [candidate division KSB1 bacterium]|nr:TonB family protein [candidate division KSB1 bacterium]